MKNRIFAALISAAVTLGVAVPTAAAAEKQQIIVGYLGDADGSGVVDSQDLPIYRDFLLAQTGNGFDGNYLDTNADEIIDVFDLQRVRENLTRPDTSQAVMQEVEIPDNPPKKADFIDAPIKEVSHSLPSQGDAYLLEFYVDFPDCHYDYEPNIDEIRRISFGEENENDPNYPFESFSAFYKRSSKGVLNLKGDVFRYTAKHEKSYYESDRFAIERECLKEMDGVIDYSKFDGNGDKIIDAMLVNVPKKAGKEHWWPTTSCFYENIPTYDGVSPYYEIIGNSQIVSPTNYMNFVRSYVHEMCHCMGIPDFYLFNSEDNEGFHGTGGADLMDVDCMSDLDCFSKLMLGWYREDQVYYYVLSREADFADGISQEEYDELHKLVLKNAQSDDGNCLIIPRGKVEDGCFSEFFIVEYVTKDGNNSYLANLNSLSYPIGEGIRVFHVCAQLCDKWGSIEFMWENASPYRKRTDDGIRLIRLVGDERKNDTLFNFSEDKDIYISSETVASFCWYDENGKEKVSPNIKITPLSLENDEYTISVVPYYPHR